MKRTAKHVGLDVHQATTVASVRDTSGRVIARTILPTETSALVEFFRGMRGTVRVAFEEGTQAQWLHDLLVPVTDGVTVCDRRGECQAPAESSRAGRPRITMRYLAKPDFSEGGGVMGVAAVEAAMVV